MRYKLILQNAIGSVEFSLETGIVVENVSSFGNQNVTFSTTKSNREIGETLDHQNVNPKSMQIMGTILGDSDAIREQMTHVISPLAESKLIYNDEYELSVYVKNSPDIERYPTNARFSFSLYAPYPYWQRKEKDVVTLVGVKPLFMFPWNISDPNPFKFSEIAEEGYVTVVNSGEAPVGWTIDFLALDEVVNPSIYNMATEEKIQIYKTLVQGEQLSISTEGDELTVTSIAPNGKKSDAFKYLDIESMPFKLAVGENYIKTEAENNLVALRANISFRTAFVGV